MSHTIVEGSWQQLDTPTLATTGTWDIQPSFWPDWRMHLTAFNVTGFLPLRKLGSRPKFKGPTVTLQAGKRHLSFTEAAAFLCRPFVRITPTG